MGKSSVGMGERKGKLEGKGVSDKKGEDHHRGGKKNKQERRAAKEVNTGTLMASKRGGEVKKLRRDALSFNGGIE